MSLVVVFHELAERELYEAATYYAEIRESLGGAFVTAVERAVKDITSAPRAGANASDGVRWWPVRRFPYMVFYRLGPDELRVLAIAHHRRRPGQWRGRT